MDYEEICNQTKHYFMRISELLGIEWAPRDIPVDRRLQTLGAASWAFIVLFGEGFSIYLTIQLLYTRFWWLIIIYCVWMLNDIDICHQGGRRREWVRNWVLWRYYCDYFPIGLQKTQDLDPSKNYLFAIFPHGFLSSGVMGALGSNARDFPKLFPGMKYFSITLAGHFLVPLFREFLLAMGACSSSKESLLHLLDSKKNQGNCVGLIVGGAQEALHFKPGEYSILLSKRKGFIKIAIKSGAPIVPVFAFGEPDIYKPLNNPEDGWLRKFQDNFRKLTGISPLLPLGRGLFQYSYGVLPLRSPINVVVGTPMEVKKNLDPTDEEIEFYHAEFTQKLIDLFETNKSKYLKKYEDLHLKIN